MAKRVRDRGGEASRNKQGVETRALSLGYMQLTHGIMHSFPTSLWVSRGGGGRVYLPPYARKRYYKSRRRYLLLSRTYTE